MVFSKPHLIKDALGSSATGNEAGKLQVFFKGHVKNAALKQGRSLLIAPMNGINVKLLESEFMPSKEVLRIMNANRVFGMNHINYGSSGRAGKVGKSVSQPVRCFSDTLADETKVRHVFWLTQEDGNFNKREIEILESGVQCATRVERITSER
jgi:hypothetical protein